MFALSMPFGWEISIHALLTEGDRKRHHSQQTVCGFSIHALLTGGRQIVADSVPVGIPISIHALLTEGDSPKRRAPAALGDFNPRPSSRRATGPGRCPLHRAKGFQSTPSSRRGRQENIVCITDALYIFIHALLTEGDDGAFYPFLTPIPISIHALLTEGDPPPSGPVSAHPDFIHALLTEGDCLSSLAALAPWWISIHAPPHGGRQCEWADYPRQGIDFNPRPPHGGRRWGFCFVEDREMGFPIHALLTEGDRWGAYPGRQL